MTTNFYSTSILYKDLKGDKRMIWKMNYTWIAEKPGHGIQAPCTARSFSYEELTTGRPDGASILAARVQVPFRLYDDDNELYFEGIMFLRAENEVDFDPLDDYGAAFGCTTLRYKSDKGWETL